MWKQATEKRICLKKEKKKKHSQKKNWNQQVADNELKSSPQTSPKKENAHHWFELHRVSGSVWEMRSGWVCDLPTYQQVARGPVRSTDISARLAPARSIALIFARTRASCETCVNWGRRRWKLHRRWVLCFLSAQHFVLTFWTHQHCCMVNITSSEDWCRVVAQSSF